MSKIVQKDDPVLREVASEVPIGDIETQRIQDILTNMQIALKQEHDGVALAAPQIGESLRIFIVSKKVFEDAEADKTFINPEITKHSKQTEKMHEGCLSVRTWYGSVDRYTQTTVRACDENGEQFTMGASGLLSQIFQHEIDHLNGVLFIDKAVDLQEIAQENEEQ